MTVAAAGSVNSTAYQPQVATPAATKPSVAPGLIAQGLKFGETLSGSGLPTVRLTADQLAILQHGAQPDPAQQAALAAGDERQATTRAYALIKDAQTGQVIGGVFPGVANVSAADIGQDPRLQQGGPAEQTQALAEDIQKAIGKGVTIQYFSPNDTNAPTFDTYWSLPRSTT